MEDEKQTVGPRWCPSRCYGINFCLAAMALGLPFNSALAVGFVFTLSSTAIVLQTLNEKGLMNSNAGKDSFSVLLVQDIAVIPMLAVTHCWQYPNSVSRYFRR